MSDSLSKVIVVVSVDWEGRSLLAENLQTIAAFRRKHRDVPMQHFLNPAYYTRPGIDASQTTKAIQDVLQPDDDHGLHIHAWHSLLVAAGVSGRSVPGFSEGIDPIHRAPDDWGYYPDEKGYDVPLESFEATELDKIIQTSIEILTLQGFRRPTSFRAGGWMAGCKVQAALAKAGFVLDCSAGDPRPVARRFGSIPLVSWLSELWPSIDEASQPFRLATPGGMLWELPNNGSLADYTPAEEIVAIFERNVARWHKTRDRHRFISVGFHQETARKFLDRLDEAIGIIQRLADERGVPLIFTAKPYEFLD